MTFDEASKRLRLSRRKPSSWRPRVWGTGEGAFSQMDTCGVLRRMEADDSIREWLERRELLGEESVVLFGPGTDHSFSLWRSRFVAASIEDLNGIAITTRDGALRVRRDRPMDRLTP